MAGAAGLSLGHFSHAFKKETGIAPAEYIRKRKMEYACSLLLSTPMPLKTIAEQLGYADEYVSRYHAFRRFLPRLDSLLLLFMAAAHHNRW